MYVANAAGEEAVVFEQKDGVGAWKEAGLAEMGVSQELLEAHNVR